MRIISVTTILLLMAAAAKAQPAAPLQMIRDGQSPYVIVKPEGADPRRRVQRAALLLQQILGEASGCKLPIVTEDKLIPGTPAIFLGTRPGGGRRTGGPGQIARDSA